MARFSDRFRRRPPAAPIRRRSPVVHPGASLVASGRAIDIADRKQLDRYRRRINSASWQPDAALFDSAVPILGFCHDYVRDSLARVRPFPAIMSDDPDEPPVPITKETAPKGLDPELCDEIVQRLAPFPEYMGNSARTLDVFGECHVVLRKDREMPSGERCQVLSYNELFAIGDSYRIREAPDDAYGVAIDKGTPLWRLWTRDPQWGEMPYSHMVRLNLACEQLLLLNRLIKAVALSRLATTGQIIAIADEFELESATEAGKAATEDAGDGEIGTSTFFDDFMSTGAAAMLDPESAAAVMPMIVRGPRELIKDGINVIDVYRKMEDTLLKLRQEAREEIATGVNLPREIPLGVGSTNHWNAEEIRTQAWQIHLEPRALSIMSGTTSAFFRPSLLANKVDPDIVRRCLMWYDPKWFLGAPDLAESADSGLEHFAISLDSWRTAKGYSPDDAPSDKEIQMRLGWQQQGQVRTTRRDDIAGSDPEVVPPENGGPAAIEPGKKQEGGDQTVTPPAPTDTTAPAEGDAAAEADKGKKKPPKKKALTAAASDDNASDGVMLALMVPPPEAAMLAELMGEDPEQHITLAYLGHADELDDLQRAALVQITRDVAARHAPLDGMTTPGTDEFGDGPDERAIVIKPYIPGIHALHHDLVAACEAAGLPVRTEFAYANYRPHITLGYIDPDAPDPAVEVPSLPLHFAGVNIRIAMQDIQCPFGPSAVPAPQVAAGRREHPLTALGRRQVAIERDTRTRIQQITAEMISRALEKVGMRVKSKATSGPNRRRPATAAMFDGRAAYEIPAMLGPDAVHALGLHDQQLLDGALTDLEGRYKLLVKRAQHAAAQAAAQAAGTDYDPDELDERMDPHRDASWKILSAGLMGLALSLLYNPHPSAPDVGEFDETTLVPPGLIRAALSRAGGAPEGDTRTVRGAEIPEPTTPVIDDDTAALGGATAGPAMLDDFYAQLGISTDEMIWIYGDAPRSREFEPHKRLDGTTFFGWNDDALVNDGDFPDYDHLFPGDHNGCGCDAAYTFTQAGETTVLDPGEGIDISDLVTRQTRTDEADAMDAPRRTRGAAHGRTISLVQREEAPIDRDALSRAAAVWAAGREAVQLAADAHLGRARPQPGPASDAARLILAAMTHRDTKLETTDPLYRLLPDPDGALAAMFTAGTQVAFALAPFDRADRKILDTPTSRQVVLTTTGSVQGLGLFGEILLGGQFQVDRVLESGQRTIVTLSQTGASPPLALEFDESQHPRDGRGRFGEGGGGATATTGAAAARALLAANPQKPGEADFEYQSRIVSTLEPEARHEMLFQMRERYEPVGYIASAAERWRADHDLPDPKIDVLEVRAPLEKGDTVARVYENATDQSGDPRVQAAYDDFKRQSNEMYDFVTRPESEGGCGIKVDFSPLSAGDPYPSASAQSDDLRENHHITIQSGLGGDHSATMTTDEYDRFRAVHDVFGHAGVGGGFDRHGEFEAYLEHRSMYSGPGAIAMATEYHGVNTAMWAGEPGTPGTGKSMLLPESLARDPWDDQGNLVALAGQGRRMPKDVAPKPPPKAVLDMVGELAKKLKLAPEFAGRFDHLPWHFDGPITAAGDFDESQHPRDSHGRFGDGGGGDTAEAAGTRDDPIKVGDDLDRAAQLISEGKVVELDQPDEVSTLLDKLAGIAKDAEARGEKAPNYNLCNVTVEGTNLFCNENQGVPRIDMPQFSGTPVAGSPADELERDKRGEVNASAQFVAALKESGVGVTQETLLASHLRASQNELVGAKVAGMMQAYQADTLPAGSIFVTRDNYVLDGHHRWAAVVGSDAEDGHLGDLSMPVQKLDMDIGAAIAFANDWTKEYGIAPKGA